MSHPDWALKHKKKGTELRNLKGRYYLYRISSKWDKEKKRSKKITHEMIGRITEEDGLIPSKTKRKNKKPEPIKSVSTKEFGATNYLQSLGNEIIQKLKNHFPSHWRELFVIALMRFIHRSPLKNIDFFYQTSYLSENIKELDLSKNRLTNFFQEIGGNREQMVNFMKNFVDNGKQLVFDVTNVISKSQNVQMAKVGYNSQKNFDPQINLFYLFSVDKQSPVFYRIFSGNINGMSALNLCIKEAGLKNCIAVGDKGFCCEKNIEILNNSQLNYVLPLKRNSKHINYERLSSGIYKESFDGHFFYQGRLICHYTLKSEGEKKVC